MASKLRNSRISRSMAARRQRSHLQNLGIANVKIDRSFVQDLVSEGESQAIRVRTGFPRRASYLAPGCVLLDIRMPEMSGFEVLSVLRKSGKRFPVVVMTGHGDVPTAVMAMKLGADDFLEKPFAENVVLSSLEMLSERVSSWAEDDRILAGAREKTASLNQRELEVLRGLIAGYSNKVIAQKLSLSVRTVESYRADVMRKLQISSVAALVRLGALVNLTPLD